MTESDTNRVWDLLEKIPIAMLATWNGRELRSRPMAAFIRRDEGAIYFLSDVRRHKDDEIREYPKVCVAFSDPSNQKYVSISGHATAINDRAKIKKLWSIPAKAWWDFPDDPNIRVLLVIPDDAEFWDSPSTVVSYVKMAAAAMTGTRPDIGKNRKVVMG